MGTETTLMSSKLLTGLVSYQSKIFIYTNTNSCFPLHLLKEGLRELDKMF